MLQLLKSTTPPSMSLLLPARQALAEHFVATAALDARLDRLGDPARLAAAASATEERAKAALDLIAEAEEARLKAWTADPSGPMPEPLSGMREAALLVLADAAQSADRCRQQAEAVAPHARALVLQRQDMDKRQDELINAVLVEEAQLVARDYYRAIAVSNAAVAALKGLSWSLCTRGDGRANAIVNDLLFGGDGPSRSRRNEGQARHNNVLTQEWSKLAELLRDDPTATPQLTPYEHDAAEADRGAA